MRIEPPKIDEREFSQLFDLLKTLIPHYTPEWAGSDKDDPGVALLKIFSRMAENVIHRLNHVPLKNFVSFLDMLGIKRIPAQPARVSVTFKLAKGTDKEIFIPARTQTAADKTAEHDELPFETEKNLQGTPSQLKKVISIDPEKDAIYIPPPGFLDEEQQEKQSQVTYKIVSSPPAGSKNFQLDHVTDLKLGDFLAIGDKEKEYVIISKISGMIVYITDRLLREYSSNTPVEKITKFSLFEGKNMQEHSLYIGHKDLFNIKSTAQFTIYIIHRAGTEGGVTPLKLSWEYWGEVKGEEGEDWQKFNAIDGTAGLSKNGYIELNKIAEGEVKEKEINGLKSRWIRCIVKEPLGINASRRLPVLDNIVFRVQSSAANVAPDLAFNNDTPLDISKPYPPFGNEPRIFDNFLIASKEVFSKKGAKVEIDVEVEKRGILGAPTAIIYVYNKIKVFARGSYGRLMEVEIDPTGTEDPVWTDHGFPPDTKIAPESTPSAVTYFLSAPVVITATTTPLANISVFARAENGHLVERFYNGNQWQWIDHGTTEEGVKVSFDPSVIYGDNTVGHRVLSVFVCGSDGNLYEFYRSPDNMVGEWQNRTRPPDNTFIASSPYAVYVEVTAEYAVRVMIFAKGENGHLYELDCKAGSIENDTWTDHRLPGTGIEVYSRPFAQVYQLVNSGDFNGYHAKVFVKGTDDALWEFDTATKDWGESLGFPNEKIKVNSAPHGYILRPASSDGYINKETPKDVKRGEEGKRIFVRGTDNCLWERNDSGWIPHQAPANSKLFFSPFVLDVPDYGLRIFSASDRNSIVKRNAPSKTWNEYKDPNETTLTPTLSWEYWNTKGWLVLKGLEDETKNLLKSGRISFYLPLDIEETEVAGQKSYWIRARIVGGDYGRETFALSHVVSSFKVSELDRVTQQLISIKDTIRPPVVNSLTISYVIETKQYPQQCVTYNNLEYLDQTEAGKTEDKFFSPFVQLEDTDKILYLGFDKPLKGGPINVFFAAKELPFTEEKKPKPEWTYSIEDDWSELKGYLDYTEGLIRSDVLELIGPLDFSARSRFSEYLFWLRGSLTKGEYDEYPVLDGIYPNTTWSTQAETIKDEIIGSSNGEANQSFSFLKFPILDGEEIRVREIVSEEEKQDLIEQIGKNALYEVKDEKGKVIETWVLWAEVPDFFESAEKDRHYTLDRATGQLQFGDGVNGMIPPAGDNNINAFIYQTGGGAQGNVLAGEIKTLKTTVPGVDKASNPVAADGGADAATLEEMIEIGPAMISHRNRAVTAEDFEWLAKQASRKVAKVKCLPNTNNKINIDKERENEIGWVTVIIVPDEKVAEPVPSLELKRKVRKYLENHCADTLSIVKHINVDIPFYVKISVLVNVFVTSMDKASEVERSVKEKLDAFFHPLTGGPEEIGWDFGRDVSASDIYALLEDIEGVDHVENLKFSHNGITDKETVEIGQNFLVANGRHTINIQIKKEIEQYESA
jgi:hypothetical protein